MLTQIITLPLRLIGMKSNKKQITKYIYQMPLNKFTIISFFLICGVIWAPLSMVYTLKDPIRSHYLLGKIGLGGLRFHQDVTNIIKDKYNQYAPSPIKNAVDRYNIDAMANLPAETAGYKQPPMNYRITRGISKIMGSAI